MGGTTCASRYERLTEPAASTGTATGASKRGCTRDRHIGKNNGFFRLQPF